MEDNIIVELCPSGLPAIAEAIASAGGWNWFIQNRCGNKMFYTYVLKSSKDKNLYIGWTDNLDHRLEAHNNGKVESTKNRVPLEMVYYEAGLSKEKAIKREKQLKTGFGRKYLFNRI